MNERARSELKLVADELSTSTVSKLTSTVEPIPIVVGDLVGGRYLIEREIGVGGVGVVYAARNVDLDEPVALKFLKPESMSDPGIVGRFAREAKAAVSIKSEHVASVFDVGNHRDGRPFLVMEYLNGKDLGVLLGEQGKLPLPDALEYTMQACEALAVAHSKGIVHRDIKPENIMIAERGTGINVVKVLDFGISKAALKGQIFGENLPMVTTSNLMGTPMYMSPEQVRCQDNVDSRCDIWSLGMVLYEMLAGAPPFHASTVPELCAAILEQTPAPLESFRRDIPPGLNDVVMMCLQKNVDERYQNVAELASALRPFAPKRARINAERALSALASTGRLTRPVSLESESPRANPSAPSINVPGAARVPHFSQNVGEFVVQGSAMPPAQQRNGNGLLLVIGGLLLALGATGALLFTRSDKSGATPSTPASNVISQTAANPTQVENLPVSVRSASPTTSGSTVATGEAGQHAGQQAPKGVQGGRPYVWGRPTAAGHSTTTADPTPAATAAAPVVPPPATKPAKGTGEPDLGY